MLLIHGGHHSGSQRCDADRHAQAEHRHRGEERAPVSGADAREDEEGEAEAGAEPAAKAEKPEKKGKEK